MKQITVGQLASHAFDVNLPPGAEAPGEGRAALNGAPIEVRIRVFLWLRVALTTGLFLFSAAADYQSADHINPSEMLALLMLLLGSLGFSLVSAGALRLKVPPGITATIQVCWDYLFSVAWIYCTGGTGSLFLFLYLYVIIEASFLLNLRGIILAAFFCALSYWMELHLEFHDVLTPTRAVIAAPVVRSPETYPVANFIFILAAMLSTAWLTSHLKSRFLKADILLQEKVDNIHDLLRINESIVRCVRSGIVTLDRLKRITSINEAASSMTDYSKEEILGREMEDFLGPIPLEELSREDANTAIPFRWEQSFSTKQGETLTFGCSGAVLQDRKGEEFGHLIIFQDLTHYKRMEAELRRRERLAAIGELAAGLAHEIRNPLASMYGSIQLLQGDLLLEGSQERLMNIILQESERLNGLITDFLLFASPNPEQREALPVLPLVEEVMIMFKQGAAYREGIRFELDIDPGVRIWGNRKLIVQIFWNLFLNAAQALSGEGDIAVEALSTKGEDGQGAVALLVMDNGRGIPKENVGKVFDPFFTSRQEGTGLGLSVVYRIVEHHGGKIDVISDEGKGTIFRIELPSSDAGQDDPAIISC